MEASILGDSNGCVLTSSGNFIGTKSNKCIFISKLIILYHPIYFESAIVVEYGSSILAMHEQGCYATYRSEDEIFHVGTVLL